MTAIPTIPGIPATRVEAVWLFGSRAMDRHGPGSDIDLCLEGPALNHSDRLALMAAVDDLLLPWRVDLVLRQELPAELGALVQRVGRRIWEAPIPATSGRPEP
ncbi:nucleotidyltransferase domain-containing protein [Cyanobium sp. BA20m-p-22]|uniref:nucleotidyltransferase domain-containing protein n=1 Tax=Cyanobium sp. BA20m-p-22 TaxID=2823704 RepID=UPI0020CE00ED|nr:nucleotidyltransferase domain-containing protein [Cyanobium sp. BA20m-p-22]MCP9911303.1 nucleotidyltransferase domain-containing protein [Cyanobium sp. BA20m-p-22]